MAVPVMATRVTCPIAICYVIVKMLYEWLGVGKYNVEFIALMHSSVISL